jgi:hypothetical protein
MDDNVKKLEQQLDSYDASTRRTALESLHALVTDGKIIPLPTSTTDTNIHYHTFFSYNAEGYSPSRVVWETYKVGLLYVGMVDFDVFDGLEEFYSACELFNMKGSVGMETRAFVPEFASKQINSPGEPGVTYHMGAGFPGTDVEGDFKVFKDNLGKTSKLRNLGLVQRVNAFLSPIELDYDADVSSITPSDNATERHICQSYATKAAKHFAGQNGSLEAYWGDKLSCDAATLDLPDSGPLQAMIRKVTMKQGGVGYVQPDSGSFPAVDATNAFILAAGGIPMLTWLDGTSDGEQDIRSLIEIEMASGVEAVNIIPDRNYSAGKGLDDPKYKHLCDFIAICNEYDLPIIVGTEMNSPGLKFVDNFKTAELSPFVDTFINGAAIVYAHAMLSRHSGFGYTSDWANKHFPQRKDKNRFFFTLGESLTAAACKSLSQITKATTPSEILNLIKE